MVVWKQGKRKLIIALTLVLVLQLFALSGAMQAEGTGQGTPRFTTGVSLDFEFVNERSSKLIVHIDRDQLPEAVQSFSQYMIVPYKLSAASPNTERVRTLTEAELDQSMIFITPQLFETSPFGRYLDAGRFDIVIVLLDAEQKRLGYFMDKIQIPGSNTNTAAPPSNQPTPTPTTTPTPTQQPLQPTPTPPAGNQQFTDVGSSHWAYEAIINMAQRNILSGYPDGMFRPDRNVTRAELAKIMVLAAGLEPSVGVTQTSFEDTSPSDWFTPYVEAALPYLNGYLLANGNVAYKPNEPALREDITIGVVKLRGFDHNSLADNSILQAMFSDYSSISQSARSLTAIAVENRLVSGFPDGTFRPQAPITRAEAATMLSRAFEAGSGNKILFPSASPTPTTASPTPAPTSTPAPKLPNRIDPSNIHDTPFGMSFGNKATISLSSQIIRVVSGIGNVTSAVYGTDVDMSINLKGTHSSFLMQYDLDERASRFTANLALKDGAPAAAMVKFMIVADNRVLYTSNSIAAGEERNVDLDVSGVSTFQIYITPLNAEAKQSFARIRNGTLYK
ncbi:S-layer homology domain-containing protein [Paenibacillus koleovorans]|uniref:S-layer homology domain-containing protein n=1 Tax=Paenibacillus koleovorans TaxID=121608 RepID=UPI000FDC0801|nr:S-layer homology domain-containing protein [Paenibacillus koleovorans]